MRRILVLVNVGILVAVVVATVLMIRDAGHESVASSAVPAAKVDRFDGARAWSWVKRQIAYGQRPAGSPQLRRVAEAMRRRMPRGRYEDVPGQPGVRNVIGTIPGMKPAVVIGAHYDTLTEPKGFVGANNGAAGTAIVVQLARQFSKVARIPEAPEIQFVLFDGEEPPAGLPEDQTDFYSTGLRGSRDYVRRHRAETSRMILLDYVANKGLRLPRERTSNLALWVQIRKAAAAVGAGRYFPPGAGAAVIDDHSPFLNAGIPAVDMIDWNYEGHTTADTLDKLSVRSMDAVGETLTEYLRRFVH
jgi:glutaminyl-peptide cyclotransferase